MKYEGEAGMIRAGSVVDLSSRSFSKLISGAGVIERSVYSLAELERLR